MTKLIGRAKMYCKALAYLSQRDDLAGIIDTAERGARYLALGVRLANELQIDKALKLSEPLALATNTKVVIAKREAGLVVFQFELAGAYWEKYTRSDLKNGPGRVGLGLSDGKRQVDFSFDPPHCLVCGTTGAGKSEAVKSLLTGLFTAYAPGELQAVIVDPDGDHADSFRNVAHLAGVGIASDPADIDRVLTYAHQEFVTRKRANDRTRTPFVVVVDEAEDALTGPRLALVEPIARHGRKYNCNLILATQKPSENALPGLLDKINHRFVGLVQTAHLSAYLTGQAGLDAHKLTGKGDFIRVAGAHTDRLLVALATNTDIDRLPRADLASPEIIEGEVVVLPDPPEREAGRPRVELDPRKIAYYLLHEVTRREAKEKFGIGQPLHLRHKTFAQAVATEAGRLYQLKGATNGRQA
jgi:hypothetical protein